MFRIRVLSEKDFPFAIRLTDTMDWGLAEEDFRFMMDLEPSGCFVAIEDGKAVGLATTINFGQVGWIGNVIIEKDRRNRGIGSLLVEHAMNYLKQRKTETIGLYAYLRAVPLYSRLGFRTDTNLVVLEGQSVYGRIANEMADFLQSHGHASPLDVRGVALKHLPAETLRIESLPPTVDEEACSGFGLCNKSCTYSAIAVNPETSKAQVDSELCYGC